jgi:hypothetical protein
MEGRHYAPSEHVFKKASFLASCQAGEKEVADDEVGTVAVDTRWVTPSVTFR